jgi:hypothetical protein
MADIDDMVDELDDAAKKAGGDDDWRAASERRARAGSVRIQAKEPPMNAHSVLAHLFHLGSNGAQAAAELLEAEQPIRLTPALTADELPPGFEEILEDTANASRRFTAVVASACSIRFGRLFPRTDSKAYSAAIHEEAPRGCH